MEEKTFKVGDIVRHIHLNKTTDLLVIEVKDTTITARYGKDGYFYVMSFGQDEVQIHVPTVRKPISYY